MTCLWTSLPSSIVPKPAHALITWTKVNLLVLTPHHIWQKSCITFSGCPSFTHFAKKCSIALCLVPLQLSVLPPMAAFIGPQVLPMSSCVQNPDQADQSCILHILGINGIIRTEKAALTFSISILHLPTFSSLLLLSPKCEGPEENFCQV